MCDIFLEFYLCRYIYNNYFIDYFYYLLIIIVITINARNIPSRIDGLYIYIYIWIINHILTEMCFHPFHLCLKHDSETTSPYGFRRWLHPNQLLLAQSFLSPSKCNDKGISQTLVPSNLKKWFDGSIWGCEQLSVLGVFGFDTSRYQFGSQL